MSKDVNAERAVLAGLYQYGSEVYLDIADMVNPDTFTVDINQVLFKCIEVICKEDTSAQIDLPSILGAAKKLNLDHIVQRKNEMEHLASITKFKVELKNVRKFAGIIRRLQVARLIASQAEEVKQEMMKSDGSQTISQLIGSAEDLIFDFTSLLNDDCNQPKILGADAVAHIEYLADNPVKNIGIPSGFKQYDMAIGGGLRKATLNVIGARPKTGKTVLTDNIGFYVAGTEKLPVLNLDTEMTEQDHINRSIAMMTDIPIHSIETGQFGFNPRLRTKARDAAKRLSEVPYFYRSIAGVNFEDQLALMRRRIHKEVGLNEDGTAKDCVIIYDYLKLMESAGISDAMREYQVLGFMMTTLHNFAVRYKVPFVILMQLNRDGIDGEDTSAASGSDRIIWLCSNFTIFKKKSPEETAQDGGPQAGNRKLIVVVSRHGEGHEFGNYVNMHMNGKCAKITEGQLRSELADQKQNNKNEDGVTVYDNEDGDEEIPFNTE